MNEQKDRSFRCKNHCQLIDLSAPLRSAAGLIGLKIHQLYPLASASFTSCLMLYGHKIV